MRDMDLHLVGKPNLTLRNQDGQEAAVREVEEEMAAPSPSWKHQ